MFCLEGNNIDFLSQKVNLVASILLLHRISSKQAKRKSKHNYFSKRARSSSLYPHHNVYSSDKLVFNVPITGIQTKSKFKISVKLRRNARHIIEFKINQLRKIKTLEHLLLSHWRINVCLLNWRSSLPFGVPMTQTSVDPGKDDILSTIAKYDWSNIIKTIIQDPSAHHSAHKAYHMESIYGNVCEYIVYVDVGAAFSPYI